MTRGLPRWQIIVVYLLPVCHDISYHPCSILPCPILIKPYGQMSPHLTYHLSPPQCSRLIVVSLLPRQPNLTADTATVVDSFLHCRSCHHCRGYILIDISLPILQRRRGVGTKIPQLLPQLQTPEQNGGAAPIDALMPASTEGLQWWPGEWLVCHKWN